MNPSSENLTQNASQQRIRRAQENYEKCIRSLNEMQDRRNSFLQKNDEKYATLRRRTDASLSAFRQKTDSRIEKRRQQIDVMLVKNDPRKKEQFEKNKQRTDSAILSHRRRQDERLKKHREAVLKKREGADRRAEEFYEDERIRQENRLHRRKADIKAGLFHKNRVRILIVCCFFIALMILLEITMPGTFLKRKQLIDDTPIEDDLGLSQIQTDLFPPKQYDILTDMTEEQLLWDLLLEHFDGNQTAALGVMCNLYCESEFKASNLEDYNNQLWNIADEEYTEHVNLRTINKQDFLEARHSDTTNGYLNKDNNWVNLDGGYGYAQFTAYDKKEGLYQFAEQWFGPGGEGDGYRFNIGDPKMQAHYVINLLSSSEYSKMDHMIRHSAKVVDACYYWLKMYEIPYDPYCDDYFTLAFERAANADRILENCKKEGETP